MSSDSIRDDMSQMVFNKDDWSTSVNGLVFRKVVLELVFYFYEDEALRSRAAMIKIMEEYADIFGPKLRWTTNPDTGKWKALKNGYRSYMTLDEWLMKAGDGVWEFIYHGAQDRQEAGDILICGVGSGIALAKKGFSRLFCYFPVDDANFSKSIQELTERAYKWAKMLKPFHGYGGYALATSHDLIIDSYVATIVLDSCYSCTHPGININSFTTDSNHLTKEIKSADWLTFLSDHFLEKLGGSDKIKMQLTAGDGLVYRPYPGGAMIMAGPRPETGDGIGWDDPVMEPYRQVGRIVEPIRMKKHKGYFRTRDIILEGGCKYLSPPQFRVWLARFSPKETDES
ncbi:hypothetical protein C4J81_00695 [Deltaproteobacteria bacterium Smac51]|nr:hypothetical protein C4J81_00695 [Deltaproteobacteria bacterium Smac51]